MEIVAFTVIAISILGFGLISGRVQKSVITPPMVFVLFGLLISSKAFGLITFDIENRFIHGLAEITLVLVLFTDAARIDLRACRREHNLAARLLVFGLPLTIIFGTLVGTALFDDFSFWGAAVLAAILAPTDAALGQAVVSSPLMPARIRQTLNVESGLNDGIMLPVILILLSLAGAAEQAGSVGFWIQFAAMQVILGPIVGIGVGYAGGKLISLGTRTGWMSHAFQELSAIGLSLLSFAGAELIGGNGFIAAFCAGLTLGNSARPICSCLYDFAEAEGQLLTLLVFMIFGAVIVPTVIDHVSWLMVLYAVLSLTVVRIVPVSISLLGARLQRESVLFFGWFGPRGLASILFALLVLEETRLPGREEIQLIVMATVLLSVFVHGVTAFPGAKWYAARMEAMKSEQEMEEHMPVSEMPVRLPFSG